MNKSTQNPKQTQTKPRRREASPFCESKTRKTEPGDHLGTKHLDPTVRMVRVESFMVAPTGWRRERLYRTHSVKSAVTAR